MRDMDAYLRGVRSAEAEQAARAAQPGEWGPVEESLLETVEDVESCLQKAAQGNEIAASQADFLRGYLSRWD